MKNPNNNQLIIDDKFLEWLKKLAKKGNKEFYYWNNTRWDEKK